MIGAVQQIGVEEKRIAGVHLDVDQLLALQQFFHALHVGAGLVSGQNVLDAPGMMRAANHLQAAVLPRGGVNGY